MSDQFVSNSIKISSKNSSLFFIHFVLYPPTQLLQHIFSLNQNEFSTTSWTTTKAKRTNTSNMKCLTKKKLCHQHTDLICVHRHQRHALHPNLPCPALLATATTKTVCWCWRKANFASLKHERSLSTLIGTGRDGTEFYLNS